MIHVNEKTSVPNVPKRRELRPCFLKVEEGGRYDRPGQGVFAIRDRLLNAHREHGAIHKRTTEEWSSLYQRKRRGERSGKWGKKKGREEEKKT